MKQKAFTLIELLIVVAIIAILAAIAVPNFLEAQTRSKVARVQNDMRSFATAIQSYMVDNNGKIITNRTGTETREYVFSRFTTPIAYITSIPKDPFNTGPDGNSNNSNPGDTGNRTVAVWGKDIVQGWPLATRTSLFDSPISAEDLRKFKTEDPDFIIFSLGPDLTFSPNYDYSSGSAVPKWPSPVFRYDATNGTKSFGDIVRSPNQ